MKKVFAIILAVAMILSMAACGNTTPTTTNGGENNQTGTPSTPSTGSGNNTTVATDPTEENSILSKYPADINDWTSQNVLDYFTEVGVFTNAEWAFIQTHEEYYAGTPVDDCVSYMDYDGMVMICIFTFDPQNEDADVNAALESIRSTQTMPAEVGGVPVDHMVGNLAFFYSFTADEEVYNAFDAAYKELIAALGVTPDF